MNPALFADDPNWCDNIPEQKSGGPHCGLPDHSDCTPLDSDCMAEHLMPGGTLGTMSGYESRPGQLDMVRAITRAYNSRTHLMIEAGTGVGKSLAYLVPSVNWALVNDTPVVISTATRNLQSQLISSDIPRAVTTADGPVRVALLKGRANYLCLNAFADLMRDGYYAMTKDEREEFAILAEWVNGGADDGDLDRVNVSALRNRVNCTGEDCAGAHCPFRGKCFVQKARNAAMRAHVVVANHSLVLAEATGSGGGLLPAYGRLVLDEAHNLEDIATEFFSFEVSRQAVARMVGKLTRKGRGGREKGVLGSVQRHLAKGQLADSDEARVIRELTTSARKDAIFALSEADALMETSENLFNPEPSADVIRFRRTASGKRQYSLHGPFADYAPDEWDEERLAAAILKFETRLANLVNTLVRLSEALNDSVHEGEFNFQGELAGQVASVTQSVAEYLHDVKFVFAGEKDTHVYWAERYTMQSEGGRPGKKALRIVAAPLSVADKLKALLFDAKDSVILCSATLRVGDKFDYAAKRLGANDDRVTKLVASSPFNYFRQALTMAAEYLPDPSKNPHEYASALADLLADVFDETEGRGLVLFTAYEMMREVEQLVRTPLEDRGIELYVQGGGMTREAMTSRLKAGGKVVLFGAQSFWEGVDVAGDALSCVVLARLPFPQQGEPIVAARGEKIEEQGGSSFHDYMMPEAVIKFRQGFGRLVRTKSDRGTVIIADPRIVTKNYGALFRKSIAVSVHRARDTHDITSRIHDFFEET